MKREKKLLLAQLPLGTTNDIGTMFGLTQNYKRDLEIILNGVKKNLDIVMINGRPFVYVAAFGNYINISFDTPKKWKEIFGRLAYILFGFLGLKERIRMYDVKYKVNGKEHKGKFSFIFITNSSRIGGVDIDYPDMKLDDNKFEVLLCNLKTKQEIVKALIYAKNNGVENVPGCKYYSASNLEIEFDHIPKHSWGLDGEEYKKSAEELRRNIDRDFWRADRGAYVDSFDSGYEKVGRHTNVLALFTGVADEEKKAEIIEKVLKNGQIPHITTPYFGFYELDALCECGEFEYATQQIRSYWGGMLKLGATSIWEQYLPNEQGAEHYAMYGMKYGRSLCHAWGAGPVYLLGRYYLGVKVTSPGAKTFEVRPQTGGLEKIMGTVPLNGGYVYVEYENGMLKVYTDKSGGTLIVGNKRLALKKDENLIVNIKES